MNENFELKSKVIDEGRGVVQRTITMKETKQKLVFNINTNSSYFMDFFEALYDMEEENANDDPDQERLGEVMLDLIKGYKGALGLNYRKIQRLFSKNDLELALEDIIKIVTGNTIEDPEGKNPKA